MTHHPIYETYLSDMKRLGATPPYMSEAQVLASAGIEIEEEEVHIPFIARQSATGKCIEPSLHNHEQPKKLSKPPVMVNLLDIPKIQKINHHRRLREFFRLLVVMERGFDTFTCCTLTCDEWDM